MTFAEQLKQCREDNGLTIFQTAMLLKVDKDVYRNWESGKTFPKKKYWQSIYKYFKIDLSADEFLHGKLYMAVSMDKYQFPLVIADSPEALAKYCDVKVKSVYQTLSRANKRNSGIQQYVVVDLDAVYE